MYWYLLLCVAKVHDDVIFIAVLCAVKAVKKCLPYHDVIWYCRNWEGPLVASFPALIPKYVRITASDDSCGGGLGTRLVLWTVARRCSSSLCEHAQQWHPLEFQFPPSQIVHTLHCYTPPSSLCLLPPFNQIKIIIQGDMAKACHNHKQQWFSSRSQALQVVVMGRIFCRDYQGTLSGNLELTEYPLSEFHSKQTRAVFVKRFHFHCRPLEQPVCLRQSCNTNY